MGGFALRGLSIVTATDAEAYEVRRIRRATFVVWIIVLFKTPYAFYDSLPRELFGEVGLLGVVGGATLLDWLLLPNVLDVIQWTALIGCLAGLLWTNCPRTVLIVPLGGVWLLDSITKSLQAYPNHAQVVPLLVLLIVVIANGRNIGNEGWVVPWLSGLAVAVPYTFIGVTRLLEGGIAIFVGDTIVRLMVLSSHYHSAYGFDVAPTMLALPGFEYLVRMSLLAVTFLEVTSIGALMSLRWRTVWLIGITAFHLTSWLMMNIFFWENLLLIWAIHGPLPRAKGKVGYSRE